MSRRLELRDCLTTEELKARSRSCHDAKDARRWHALWLIAQGFSSDYTGEIVGLQGSWIRHILRCSNQQGPQAVPDGYRTRPGGARPRLSPPQRHQLCEALQGPPPSGGLWTSPKVASWISQKTGTPTYPQLGWVYLKALGLSLKVPRRRHVKAASKEQQAAFKKSQPQGQTPPAAVSSSRNPGLGRS
jgi:transposase